ncbi:MAG: serine/threonine-protein phosphatase [Desulfobacterales bacterium]|nr:serine/threonine-protein phosphatase [Desulfobacterales bacterium]
MQNHNYGLSSHVGNVRSQNEDSCRAVPDLGLWIVADGMGGHEGGEKASALAADFIVEQVREGEVLSRAIARSHHTIKQAVAEGKGPEGMGTTAVALKVVDHSCEISWVGDCRAYLWDGSELRQLTKDHSYVQQLVDTGVIPAVESDKHPYQDILIQALGAEDMDDVAVDEIREDLYAGEQILLCSDGLNKELDENAIAQLLVLDLNAQEKVDRLIGAALDNGGTDNITAILVSAADDAPDRLTEEDTVPFITQKIISIGFFDKLRDWWHRLTGKY